MTGAFFTFLFLCGVQASNGPSWWNPPPKNPVTSNLSIVSIFLAGTASDLRLLGDLFLELDDLCGRDEDDLRWLL